MDLRQRTCSGRLPRATLGGDDEPADADGLTVPRMTTHRSGARALRLDAENKAWWMPLEGPTAKDIAEAAVIPGFISW
jgi:hypothetical protein